MRDLTPDRWRRLDTLLAGAFARDPDERTAFLRAACGNDARLYGEALALLGQAGEAARLLGDSAADFAPSLLREAGPAADELGPGDRLGPYEIEAEIGRGGMGVVYLGRDTKLDRAVAIKALPEHLSDDPDRLARFEREAKTLAQLSHPNVAGIYGVEESGGRGPQHRPPH